jgi:WavE lipopolysaccharide synthesis
MTRIPWKYYKKLLKGVILFLEKFSPYYLSITTREKNFSADVLNKYESYPEVHQDYAIVMQGPLAKDNFTYETLKLYRHVYPNATLILSTWVRQDTVQIAEIKKMGVVVLENIPPQYKGISNVNLQITSTKSGIEYAKNKGCKYVLKTRTDQRCCKPVNFLLLMKNLQDYFPLGNNMQLNKRLIISSLNTFKTRLYGVSDMFMFGNVKDMIEYWCITLDEPINIERQQYTTPELFIKNETAEGYFVTHFFSKVHYTPQWTESCSNIFFQDFFFILDKEQLDLYWFKYNRMFENINILDQESIISLSRKESSDWFIKNTNTNVK